jgi:uncharacterized membrane protein YfcA
MRTDANLTLTQALIGFVAAWLISIATAPVDISGAVFLQPVQLSILNVPTPAVTPTNLVFNVIATPGALALNRKQRQLTRPLTRTLITGTLPGVVADSAIHVYLALGPTVFRGPGGRGAAYRHLAVVPRHRKSARIHRG